MRVPGQIPLRFPLAENYTLDRFRVGHNGELLQALGRARFLWIYGDAGVGKTHLLQAACRDSNNAAFLPAAEIAAAQIDLSGYETFALVLVDDVEQWLGCRDSELQLVGLIEGLKDSGGRLIVAGGTKPPTDTMFELADLASRMRAFECFELKPLPGAELVEFFVDAAGARGIELGEDVVEYLFARVGRSHADLLGVLDRLDRESLVHSRPITIPFARRILDL